MIRPATLHELHQQLAELRKQRDEIQREINQVQREIIKRSVLLDDEPVEEDHAARR